MRWLVTLFRAVAGPAAVAAAGAMGAGSVSTLILAGAWFGYDLLWVVVFTLPLFVVAVDTSSRIGTVNAGEGLLSLIRRRIHPALAWGLLVVMVPVHVVVAMGQFSIMTTAFLSLFGVHEPSANVLPADAQHYIRLEFAVSLALGGAIVWLMLSRSYGFMQKAMTMLIMVMVVCFVAVAMESLQDADAILAGLVPSVPPDLAVPDRGIVRLSNSSLIAIVGAAIAPGALLAMPYLAADARTGNFDLESDFRKCVINFGLIFGAFSVFILLAGGHVLHPLPHHAEIETVHEAGQALNLSWLPGGGSLGPKIFAAGLFIAALTTTVVCAQIIAYMTLDMLRKPWSYTPGNRSYRNLMMATVIGVSILAPLWNLSAMLKMVLLMGVNVLAIPLLLAALWYLINQRGVMGEHTASPLRNLMLAGCVALAILLAIDNAPDLLRTLMH